MTECMKYREIAEDVLGFLSNSALRPRPPPSRQRIRGIATGVTSRKTVGMVIYLRKYYQLLKKENIWKSEIFLKIQDSCRLLWSAILEARRIAQKNRTRNVKENGRSFSPNQSDLAVVRPSSREHTGETGYSVRSWSITIRNLGCATARIIWTPCSYCAPEALLSLAHCLGGYCILL